MEAQIGSESTNLCLEGTSNGTENQNLDWNINDYSWNGNRFLASQSNPSPSNCTLKPLFNSEKRRRISTSNQEETERESEAQDGQRIELDQRGINLDRPICQVDGCGVDLSNEKDYHRRHKVCSNHSKASTVSINGEIKRFCQQCSKFHMLEEFDEGKRSCRRRLDRHNGLRRKKNNQNATDSLLSLNGNQANAIIVTLLKIITNLESARQDPQTGQQILNVSELLQRLQSTQNAPDSNNLNLAEIPSSSNSLPKSGGVRDFDLNDPYFEQENEEENENENQNRTGKIVFKLFGKDPSDSPPNLRPEILTWLSNCPSEMESYIKPGCIVLTLYLRLADSKWQDLTRNLGYYIERLIDISNPNFWGTGFVYTTLEDQVVFMHNGRIILEGPLNFEDPNRFKIVNVTPIAVPFNSIVTFCVKGFNLSKSNARLFCVFDGKYLVRKAVRDLVESNGLVHGGPQCLTFSCSVPACTGRGFIEIEEYDHSGFSFPFIITDEPSCIEIRALESESKSETLNPNSLHFLQELGWLLNRLRSGAEFHRAAFRVARFKHLLTFVMSKEWRAVLKRLLDAVLTGDLQLEGCNGEEFVLGENLLFEAVRMKSERLVDFLLRYKVQNERYLFVPDMENVNNNNGLFVTPLHLAASLDGTESVLDALTDDPQKIGIKAWMSCRGMSGTNLTPKETAIQKGHNSYLHLVQTKIDSSKKPSHVHLMPGPTKHHFDVERGFTSCRLCEPHKSISRSTANRVLGNRPIVMSLLCVAAVCVCVGLIFKTPPFVKFTKPPFLWDSLQGGSM